MKTNFTKHILNLILSTVAIIMFSIIFIIDVIIMFVAHNFIFINILAEVLCLVIVVHNVISAKSSYVELTRMELHLSAKVEALMEKVTEHSNQLNN